MKRAGLAMLLVVSGCHDWDGALAALDGGTLDAGALDAGEPDAGTLDAGTDGGAATDGGNGCGGDGLVFFGTCDTHTTFVNGTPSTLSVSVDSSTTGLNNGRPSFKVDEGTSNPFYVLGDFTANPGRDLSHFNALTFWAKASNGPTTFDHVGIGGTQALPQRVIEFHSLTVGASFTKIVLPLIKPELHTAEGEPFYFSDGLNHGQSFWFSDVQYENVDAGAWFGTVQSAAVGFTDLSLEVGQSVRFDTYHNTLTFGGGATNGPTFSQLGWDYFTVSSSNTGVASISPGGLVTANGMGTARLTATFDGLDAGSMAVNVIAPIPPPSAPAPAPTLPSNQVTSLFSSAYSSVAPAIVWQAPWSANFCSLVDSTIAGGHVLKKYTLYPFAGIENFIVDASTMSYLHVDLWSPTWPSKLGFELVQDVTGVAVHSTYSTTTIGAGMWQSVDIPLATGTGFVPALTTRNKVGQFLIKALDSNGNQTPGTSLYTVYLDNLYFHQ